MAVSRPLAIGVAAMALLVVSVGFEILVHRSFAVDVRTDDGWQTIGATGQSNEPYRTKPLGVTDPIEASRNDTLQFRLRVDNGYPWSYSEHFYVTGGSGVTVAEGELVAPGRGLGEATFDVRLGRLVEYWPKPADAERTEFQTVSFNVVVGSSYIYSSFQIKEVP